MQCFYTDEMENATIRSYNWIYAPNEDVLTDIVFTFGPVVVGIDASLLTFQQYKTGVYDDEDCSSRYVNHAVLVVGFGVDDDWGEYWIIKNR